MWLSDRRAFLLGALALAGCGFTPAYAPGGPGAALRGQVRADDPTDSLGFAFVGALEERLGRPQTVRYALSYTITTSERGAASVVGVGATRIALLGRIDYALTDTASGETVASGNLRNVTNYSTTDNQLATQRAREDAEERLMRILADQVATRLLAAMAE
ncbi:MAG: lipopolysaccharide export system outer membrane lipoprotein component LptE [Roseibaca calidilacus]|uniref:LPS-assembly lipoprotein n=1 Tax=Roseibaca calidilacus TaxID=1666912 RepID=A0A0P7VV26_9RHOB|nr:LPS assembly lipoprotein LptE [Roseibaca calidilacus]KPP90950.1 MAG: lipopolysaccharide export system outer membrane lipoprotein component LptE [Roseibaca calidilacus]CUX83862.1 LPS-assembly lipoprotein [Roseibaca calidilacus]